MEPYLPLLLAALFGALAPMIARRLPPPIATWLLSIGGLVGAAGSVAVLGFLAFTLLGRAPLLATQGHWSPTALQHADPVAVPVEVAATLALAAVTVRVAAVALRRSRALLDAHRLAAALPAHGADLAVIADPLPCAYAVPGRPGRIVASVGLLRGLDAGCHECHEHDSRDHDRNHFGPSGGCPVRVHSAASRPRRGTDQRSAAASSIVLASTQDFPSAISTCFQKGARVFR